MPDSDTDKPGAHAILLGGRLAVDRTGYSGVISPFCFRKAELVLAITPFRH
jgi:hypothetical protein